MTSPTWCGGGRPSTCARWWAADGEPTAEEVERHYGPRIDGMSPTRMWVAEVNGRSVGFVQDYRIADYPEFALLARDPDAIGVDYAIGDGVGRARAGCSRAVGVDARKAAHRFADATAYFAAPDHRNAASLRMLAKAGFERGAVVRRAAGRTARSTPSSAAPSTWRRVLA